MTNDGAQLKVMVAGVVPPPVHGQSLATQAIFDADLWPVRKFLIPIRSSKELSKVGTLSFGKALGLVGIVWRTWRTWLRNRPKVLYYTAGSGAWVPFIRDVVFLSLCRPLFRTTLIHYHSGNLVEFLQTSRLKSLLGAFIYGRGAWTLRLGPSCPAPFYDGNKVYDLPNGLAAPADLPARESSAALRILFLGNLYADKGVHELIEAVRTWAATDPRPVTLSLVGKWPDEATRYSAETLIRKLPGNVSCPPPAPAYGDDKWQALAHHDLLVFPSYYSSENLPLVLIEAMAASLPVVAADWRGVSSLVEDGTTGLLVPPRDIPALAEAIGKLASTPGLRSKMGDEARSRYEKFFTLESHLDQVKALFLQALENP